MDAKDPAHPPPPSPRGAARPWNRGRENDSNSGGDTDSPGLEVSRYKGFALWRFPPEPTGFLQSSRSTLAVFVADPVFPQLKAECIFQILGDIPPQEDHT